MALLEARGVNVAYEPNRGQRIWSVRDVDLTLEQGEFVGLVGESGCGKSTLGYALTRMLRPPARLDRRQHPLRRHRHRQPERRAAAPAAAQRLRAGPAERHERAEPGAQHRQQFGDVLKAHAAAGRRRSATQASGAGARSCSRASAWTREVLRRFPHELSGGMRQRVSIALALALQPRLIVFDEPTTALDVIVQQAVMQTIKDLQAERGFTAILISHDLGVVLEATDRVMVMYAGRIVEDQPARVMATRPHHPYTEALLSCYGDPRADVVQLGGIPGSPPDLSLPSRGCSFAPALPAGRGHLPDGRIPR